MQSLHGQRLIKWFSTLFKAQKSNIPQISEEKILQQPSSHSKGKVKESSTSGRYPSPPHGSIDKSNTDLSFDDVSLLPIKAREECGLRRFELAKSTLEIFFGALRCTSNRYNTRSMDRCSLSECYRKKDHDESFLQLRQNTILAVGLAALLIPPKLITAQSFKHVYVKGDDCSTFGSMVLCAVQCFPEIHDQIHLLELRAACHHLPSLWEDLDDDDLDCDFSYVTKESFVTVDDSSSDNVDCSNPSIRSGKGCSSTSASSECKYIVWFSGAEELRMTKLHHLQKAILLQFLELYTSASCQARGLEYHHSANSLRRSNPSTPADVTTSSNFYFCASALADICLAFSGVSLLTLEDQSLPQFSCEWVEEGDIHMVEEILNWGGPGVLREEGSSFSDNDEATPVVSIEWASDDDWAEDSSFSEDVAVKIPCGIIEKGEKKVEQQQGPNLAVPLSWSHDEAVIKQLMSSFGNPEEGPKYIKMILMPVYFLIPERSHLKARYAFALGVLASHCECDGSDDIAETMFLECVMVLNWLAEEEDIAFDARSDRNCYYPPNDIPLLTHFGVNVLHKLGDILIKNKKYEYGIHALERSIDCYGLVHHYKKKQHIKLMRRVALLTLAHNDSERALRYHIQLLRGALAENNVNEFVYLGLEIARMLLEQGEYSGSEQYLIVASQLISCAKLDQVQLLSPSGDPATGEGCSITSSCSSTSQTGHFPVPEYVPPATAADRQRSGLHQSGGNSILSDGYGRSSTASVDLKLDKPSPSYSVNEPVFRSIGSCTRGSMEIREGAMDTQQFSLQMKFVNLYSVSQQYDKTLRLLNGLLLNKSIPRNHRSEVLLEVARCYLKVNEVEACGAALYRIVYEVDESLPDFVRMPPSSLNNPSTVGAVYTHAEIPAAHAEYSDCWDFSIGEQNPEKLPSSSNTSIHHPEWEKLLGDTVASSLAMTVKSVAFLSLCSKYHLAAGDPASALNWINIAIARGCNRSRMDAKRGKLFYIKARCHAALSAMATERRKNNHCPVHTSFPSFPNHSSGEIKDYIVIERTETELAREAFDRSQSLFHKVSDVRRLGKCLASEAEMHLSRIFTDVTIYNINLKDAALGDGEAVLDMADNKAALALDMSAAVASPLTMITSLLNAAEVYVLRGRIILAYRAWKEAQALLTLTYLQRQIPEEYLSEQQKDLDFESPSTCVNHSSSMGSLGKGGCAAAVASSSAAGRYPFRKSDGSWCSPALPSVSHPPCVMRRVYAILSRVIRLSFILTGLADGTCNPPIQNMDSILLKQSSEPPRTSESLSPTLISAYNEPEAAGDLNLSDQKVVKSTAGSILASFALPNSTHLLAGWLALDALVHHPCPPLPVVLHSDAGVRGGDKLHPLLHKSSSRLGSISSSSSTDREPRQRSSSKLCFNSEIDKEVASPVESPQSLDGNDINELAANDISKRLSQQQRQSSPPFNETAVYSREEISTEEQQQHSNESIVEREEQQLLNSNSNGEHRVRPPPLPKDEHHIRQNRNWSNNNNKNMNEIRKQQVLVVDEKGNDDEGNSEERKTVGVISLERCSSDKSIGKKKIIPPVSIDDDVEKSGTTVISDHSQGRYNTNRVTPPPPPPSWPCQDEETAELTTDSLVTSRTSSSGKLYSSDDYSSNSSMRDEALRRVSPLPNDKREEEDPRRRQHGKQQQNSSDVGGGTESRLSYDDSPAYSPLMKNNDESRTATASTEDSRTKSFMKYVMKLNVEHSSSSSPSQSAPTTAYEYGNKKVRTVVYDKASTRSSHGMERKRRPVDHFGSASTSLDVVFRVFKLDSHSSVNMLNAIAKESAIAFEREQSGSGGCNISTSTPVKRTHRPNNKNASAIAIESAAVHHTTPLPSRLLMLETGQLVDVSSYSDQQQQSYIDQNDSFLTLSGGISRSSFLTLSSGVSQSNVSLSDSPSSTNAMDLSLGLSPRISPGTFSPIHIVGGGGEVENLRGGSGGECGGTNTTYTNCNGVPRIQYMKNNLRQESTLLTSHESSTHHKKIRKRLNLYRNYHKEPSSTSNTIDLLNKGCSGDHGHTGSIGGSSNAIMDCNRHSSSHDATMGLGQGKIYHNSKKFESSHLTFLNSWLFYAGERRNSSIPTGGYSSEFYVNTSGLSRKNSITSSSNAVQQFSMRPSENKLWTSFCKMRQADKSYSSGTLSLSNVQSKNVMLMRKILFTGKELGRPIFRSDRSGLFSDDSSLNSVRSANHDPPLTGKKKEGNGQHSNSHRNNISINRTRSGIRLHSGNGMLSGNIATSGSMSSVQKQKKINEAAPEMFGPSPIHFSTATKSIRKKTKKTSSMSLDSPAVCIDSIGNLSTTSVSPENADHSELRRRRSDRSMDSLPPSESGYNGLSSQRRYSPTSALTNSTSLPDVMAGFPSRCHHPYPTTLAYVFFMDGAYFYYHPSYGKMSIERSYRLCCAILVPNNGAELRVCPSVLDFRWVHGLDDPRACLALSEESPRVVNQKTQTSKGTTNRSAIGSSTAATGELYDDVLNSISESRPNRCLPLVPEDDMDEHFLSRDDSYSITVDVLSPQFTLFLVTALLLEQPVLMVAKPGGERIMANVGAGLLRLLRPLQWQHTHISLCPLSLLHVLIHCINSKQPFLIGVHPSTLDPICPLRCYDGGSRSKDLGESVGSHIGGERGSSSNIHHHTSCNKTLPTSVIDMNHITIVDLDNGIVTPSTVLKYAAATTCHQNFAPDADPVVSDTLCGIPAKGVSEAAFDFLNFLKDYSEVQAELSPLGHYVPGMLPPLPAKLRHQFGRYINLAMSSLDNNTTDIEKVKGSQHTAASSFGGGGKSSPAPSCNSYNKEEGKKEILNRRCAETLRYGMFLMLVTMLKPYHLFLDVGPWKASKTSDEDDDAGGFDGIGTPNMSNFNVEAFLLFVEDDMRPFLRLLLYTKAFSVFIEKSVPFHVPPYKEDGKSCCLNFKKACQPNFWPNFERKHAHQVKSSFTSPTDSKSTSSTVGSDEYGGAMHQRKAEAQQPAAASFSWSKEMGNSVISESFSSLLRRSRPYREEFELAVRVRMRWKFEMVQDLTHERISGLLLMRMAQEGKDAMRKPEKPRWCVLDAGRFSYYKSRLGRGRKQKRKGQIALDPRSVTLITPKFMVPPSGNTTTEANSVALVSSTFPPEVACIMIRSESKSLHQKWVRALKARLIPRDTLNKLNRYYST